MKRTRLFVALACIGPILAVSVGPCFTAPKTLKIDAIYSLSGWMAPGETPAHERAVLAVGWINGKGGITVKGEKYLLELGTEDTIRTLLLSSSLHFMLRYCSIGI